MVKNLLNEKSKRIRFYEKEFYEFSFITFNLKSFIIAQLTISID